MHRRRQGLAGSALGVVLFLGMLTGCQSQGQDSCSAGQKTGGDIGNRLGQGLGRVAENLIPGKVKSYTGPLNLASNSKAGMGLLGSRIGCALNTVDQKKAVDAVQVATVTGRTQTWAGSEPGVSGKAEVVANTRDCRTVEQTITLNDGTQRTETVKSCKGSNGWEVVPE